VPFIGGLLCAERTPEHEWMYREGSEASFWAHAAECAERCRWLLEHPDERRRIAAAGRARVLQLGLSNDAVVGGIIDRAGAIAPLTTTAPLARREPVAPIAFP
jgi:hypothetical protein